MTEGYDRISMHGVRRELLVAQANSLGSPLDEVTIPQGCTNETYEQRMRDALDFAERFIDLGFRAIAVSIDTKVLGSEFAGREHDHRPLLGKRRVPHVCL
jgi:diphthamide synthase (EF-2-diphthine--ammonia ligase)